MKEHIQKLSNGNNLTIKEAENAISNIFTNATDSQIGAFLVALKMKGESEDEIIGLVNGMRKASKRIHLKLDSPIIDIVGTGGDTHNTINVSTTTAIVVASCGIFVAKHGNHAITSKSGSADVLKELGISINKSPKEVKKSIEDINIGFMLAGNFHPSMKRVVAPRREIGIRTVFNILGPLTNPANIDAALIGVFDKNLCIPFASVLKNIGLKRAMIVNGDGMDEISNISDTTIAELNNGVIKSYILTPEELGIKRAHIEDIMGSTPKENANDIIQILNGKEKGPKRDIIVMNGAAAIYVAGIVDSIKNGIPIIENAIDSGKAMQKLNEFRAYK